MSRLWGRERLSVHRKIITRCSKKKNKKIITCCSSEQKQPMCIVTPPSNNICNHLFSIAPRLCFVFYGPRLLSKMSGRKHLRCSLGLFVLAGSNHLAKLRPRNNPQIGPFLGQSCLFVCLPSSYSSSDQCSDHLSEN